jgi:hypothetical protein
MLCLQAGAQPVVTTQDVYRSCKSDSQAAQLYCDSYLTGFGDALAAIGSAGRDKKMTSDGVILLATGICKPPTSGGQLRQIFVNWAERSPKFWQSPKWFGAWQALHDAYPCDVK